MRGALTGLIGSLVTQRKVSNCVTAEDDEVTAQIHTSRILDGCLIKREAIDSANS